MHAILNEGYLISDRRDRLKIISFRVNFIQRAGKVLGLPADYGAGRGFYTPPRRRARTNYNTV
jgi:hypothetical protein